MIDLYIYIVNRKTLPVWERKSLKAKTKIVLNQGSNEKHFGTRKIKNHKIIKIKITPLHYLQFWPPDAPDAHCFGLPYSIQFGIISPFLDVLIAPPLSLYLFLKILKIEKRKRIVFKNLINREEKENFFSTS